MNTWGILDQKPISFYFTVNKNFMLPIPSLFQSNSLHQSY